MESIFGKMDLRKVDTSDIEDYFYYFHHDIGLATNTIQKHKTHLVDLWKFMKKNYQ